MAIHLTTLGGLHAVRDGVELERLVGQRLRAALLVYLAVERRAARESLTTVFWPESSSDNARHALRQSLYHLRTELGGDWLEVRTHELRANADLRADVQDFASSIEQGHPESAARLYHGPFLAGVNLIDVQPWESWVDGKRAHYARAFRKACREWVDARRAEGDLQGAVEAAQHWIVPDPLDDEAQHRLIAALADAGERTAAIRQYEAYERLLKAEDLQALEETIALVERVRSEPAGPAPASVPEEVLRTNTPAFATATESPAQRAVFLRGPGQRALVVIATVLLVGVPPLWATRMLLTPGQQDDSATAPSSAQVAVLPFSVRGGNDAAWLGEGMVNLLATALDGASVRAIDARAVFAIVAQDDSRSASVERGSRIAARLGANLFVLGDVIEAGKRLRIEAAVYRAGNETEPVIRGSVNGVAEHAFELADSLAAQLLAGLGTTPSDRLTRTAAVTTASLAAFKEYLQGEAEIRAGRFERAEEAYLRAIAHDSTFAFAYYRLALVRDWAAHGDSEEAARAAARHAERLTPRDRALLEALQSYASGAVDMERRYRAILARYPDDLDAWSQLAEVLFHFGPVRGRPTFESEQAWRKVLSYEPKNAWAIVHVARIAAAGARAAALDSLLAPFTVAEVMADRRLLQVATFRALAHGDTSALRALIQNARSWEDAAVWQLAAYLTAFSHRPAEARRVVENLIEPQRAPGMIADLTWFSALLHLQNGQLAAATRALSEANAVNAAVPAQLQRTFELVTNWWAATLPIPYPDSLLERIRRSASSSEVPPRNVKASFDPAAAGDALWFALLHEALSGPNRMEALRLYSAGVLSLRVRDALGAKAASAALARLASSPASDWFARASDNELRARIAWHEGRPEQALRVLDEQELGPVSVGSTIVAPFLANAHARYLRGELLVALGREKEALPWFESLGALSVPESAFRAPAQLRLAEIHERLGNRTEAAQHYAHFVELWQFSDPELQPLVSVARQHLVKLQGLRASALTPGRAR